jgi:Fe-S-cluster-containing dehydrogenase component
MLINTCARETSYYRQPYLTENSVARAATVGCSGCQLCLVACPFGVPQYGADGIMQKCDLCVDLIARGKEPACVANCPAEALRFGTLQELSEQAAKRAAQEIAESSNPRR